MHASLPKPWAELPAEAARAVVGVLTDIDDTLTTDGAITAEALHALARLRQAGVPVIAITGRPLRWSERFVRPGRSAWPIDAIVAENGAVALFPQDDGTLAIEYAQDAATRERHARQLAEVAQRILRDVPGSTLARDSAGRVTDIAIDHSEFAHLGAMQVDAVVAAMRSAGMNASVSSIHVNGWFGDHDKLSGARSAVARCLQRELDAQRERWVYVGDSPNDQQMFGHFPLSVGVANLMDFAAALAVWPAYLTRGARGAGFAEVVDRLLESRQRAPLVAPPR